MFEVNRGSGIQTKQEFRKFFEDFFPGVYFLLTKYTKEKETAWDLAQEAFIKIYERWADFEDTESAKAFVYTVARNLFINHYRREQLRLNIYKNLELPDFDTNGFLKNVAAEETLRILYAAIDQLHEQTRTIIYLGLKGKNNAEIAQILNVSVNTVKTLKKNAYRTLRELLRKDHFWILFLLLNN